MCAGICGRPVVRPIVQAESAVSFVLFLDQLRGTVAIDRDATLRKAEKVLRQGRLDQAIAEYGKVIQEQPRDWSTVNAVGDLLVRAGQLESGVERFTPVSYTHLRAHETRHDLVCRLLL